jgi:hypothetical protein
MTDSIEPTPVTRRVRVTFASFVPDRPQPKTLHTSRFRVHRAEHAAPPARHTCASTLAEIHGNRSDERNDAPWHYRPLPQRR